MIRGYCLGLFRMMNNKSWSLHPSKIHAVIDSMKSYSRKEKEIYYNLEKWKTSKSRRVSLGKKKEKETKRWRVREKIFRINPSIRSSFFSGQKDMKTDDIQNLKYPILFLSYPSIPSLLPLNSILSIILFSLFIFLFLSLSHSHSLFLTSHRARPLYISIYIYIYVHINIKTIPKEG